MLTLSLCSRAWGTEKWKDCPHLQGSIGHQTWHRTCAREAEILFPQPLFQRELCGAMALCFFTRIFGLLTISGSTYDSAGADSHAILHLLPGFWHWSRAISSSLGGLEDCGRHMEAMHRIVEALLRRRIMQGGSWDIPDVNRSPSRKLSILDVFWISCDHPDPELWDSTNYIHPYRATA